MDFRDKVVLVTGAGSGIGAAVAIQFAEHGAKVAIVGRREEKLKEVAFNCKNNALIIVADVRKNVAHKIIAETIKHFGKLDILINNAGIAASSQISDENAIAVYDSVMTTNVRAVACLTHFAVPYIKLTKGNIVNISSIAGLTVLSRNNFAYEASKAALDHFTRSIAAELASSGIRVNSVNPGPVKTEIMETVTGNAAHANMAYERLKAVTALNNISEAAEIADLVLFLASEKAKSITGSSYVTDNGTLCKNII